jgi:hypothetical protein
MVDMSSPRFKMIAGGSPTITITNVTKADSGDYFCVLRNQIGHGEPDSPSIVEVQTRPRVKLRMDPPSSIIEGDERNVSLSCEVEDGHTAELTRVQLFMDRILMQELPQCDIDELSLSSLCGVYPTKLILESVTRLFHGNHSCIGINKAGPSNITQPVSLAVLYAPGEPAIVQNHELVRKGGSVTFTCLRPSSRQALCMDKRRRSCKWSKFSKLDNKSCNLKH